MYTCNQRNLFCNCNWIQKGEKKKNKGGENKIGLSCLINILMLLSLPCVAHRPRTLAPRTVSHLCAPLFALFNHILYDVITGVFFRSHIGNVLK